MPKLNVNGRVLDVDADADMPLLWAIREIVGLTGTKYGCGIAVCGVVHGAHRRRWRCGTCVHAGGGRVTEAQNITTIEGLSKDSSAPGAEGVGQRCEVPQCGYCQSGHDHGGGGADPRPTRSPATTRSSRPP